MKKVFLIFILLLICIISSAQSRWIQQYLDEYNAPALELIISYDQGYLLSGWITSNFPPYTWLIKTDVNGEILWQKLIGDSYYSSIGVDNVCINANGDIYLGGGAYNNSDANPVLIKLNPCGEKEWCREIVTTSNIDFFSDIVNTPDGGCATLIYKTFFPESINRSGILKFSSDGALLWQKYYESSDQGVANEDLSNIIITPDNGFLISGFCYYPDPENTDLYWLHPYYIKTDSLGNFEWETVIHRETGDIGGDAHMTLVNPGQTFYYSCISHYYHSNTLSTTRPGIVKLNLNGSVAGIFDLVQGNFDNAKLLTFDFLNDSLLVGSAGWHNNEEEPQSRVIIFDTLGKIKDSLTLFNDVYLGITKTTYDNKILVLISNTLSGQFDSYLYKLNQVLEQDTFYTQPFVYDSLCPYQIVSDTIVPDDCGVIVGIEEDSKTVGREDGKKDEGGLEIWPNPATGIVDCRWSMVDFRGDLSLMIYDVFGREIRQIDIPDTDHEIKLTVEDFVPGLYLVVLKDENNIIGSARMVVSR
ncbi:MAG TPA: hypothetical protein PLW31_05895 [Bacteroidales bacterium]|nr:hypothetical protein [Bacteroidales bacterium]